MANLDLKNSKNQAIFSFVCTAAFAIIGFILYFVFKGQAYPAETEYFALTPDEWAWKYMVVLVVSLAFGLVFNLWIMFMAVFAKGFHRTVGSWWLSFSVVIIVAAALIALVFIKYPENSWCGVAATVVIFAQQVVTFIVSTANCSPMWRRGYFPFGK